MSILKFNPLQDLKKDQQKREIVSKIWDSEQHLIIALCNDRIELSRICTEPALVAFIVALVKCYPGTDKIIQQALKNASE